MFSLVPIQVWTILSSYPIEILSVLIGKTMIKIFEKNLDQSILNYSFIISYLNIIFSYWKNLDQVIFKTIFSLYPIEISSFLIGKTLIKLFLNNTFIISHRNIIFPYWKNLDKGILKTILSSYPHLNIIFPYWENPWSRNFENNTSKITRRFWYRTSLSAKIHPWVSSFLLD